MDYKNIFQTIREVLQTSRPISWINTAVPFAVGYLVATGQMNTTFWLGLVYFLFPYNLLMYGVNDIFDHASDAKNPRKNSVEGALLSKSKHMMLWYIIILCNIPFVISFLVLAPSLLAKAFFVVLIALCLSYSLPPLRFKEIPVLDSLNSSLHFVGPAIFGLLFASTNQAQPAIAAVVAFVLWGMASHALGAIQDIRPDRLAGIASVATKLGARRTTRLAFGGYILSAGIVTVAYFPLGIVAGALLCLYALNTAFFFKYLSDARSGNFHRAWQNFLWLNLFVGFSIAQLLLAGYDPFHQQAHYLLIIAICLIILGIAQLIIIVSNHVMLQLNRKAIQPTHWPRVSILLTAHNQAESISATLLAALGQNYPDFEVLFTDLGSNDNTRVVARHQQDERLRIIEAIRPESGWSYAAWAYEQQRKQAHGEILVIAHTDVLLYPNAISQLVTELEHHNTDIVSAQTAEHATKIWQQLSYSQNNSLLLGWYPVALLRLFGRTTRKWYGQLTIIRAAQFAKLHGFEQFKNSSTFSEDLNNLATRRGLKVLPRLGQKLATTHYHGTQHQIIDQLLGSYYAALGSSFPLTIVLTVGLIIVSVVPLLLFCWQFLVATNFEVSLLLIATLVFYINRLIVGLRLKQSLLAVIFYPFGYLLVGTLLIRSMLNTEVDRQTHQPHNPTL